MDPFNERYRLFARHLVRGECCDDEDGRYCEQGLALLEFVAQRRPRRARGRGGTAGG